MKLYILKDGDPSEEQPVGLRISYTTRKQLNRALTVWLSDEEAQHLSNRLQSFAKGQGPLSELIVEN